MAPVLLVVLGVPVVVPGFPVVGVVPSLMLPFSGILQFSLIGIPNWVTRELSNICADAFVRESARTLL
jgi:hypothetical protein